MSKGRDSIFERAWDGFREETGAPASQRAAFMAGVAVAHAIMMRSDSLDAMEQARVADGLRIVREEVDESRNTGNRSRRRGAR